MNRTDGPCHRTRRGKGNVHSPKRLRPPLLYSFVSPRRLQRRPARVGAVRVVFDWHISNQMCDSLLFHSSKPYASQAIGHGTKSAIHLFVNIQKRTPLEPLVKQSVIRRLCDSAITMASEAGQLQLNVFEPLIIYNLLQSMDMLSRGMATLRSKCIEVRRWTDDDPFTCTSTSSHTFHSARTDTLH